VDDGVRLQKFLSQAGVASRREAERLMLEGRVTVDGKPARELGVRVVAGHHRVAVDGKEVGVAVPRWILFHKPPGILTTRHDPHGGRTLYDVLPDELGSLRYVGRLDRDAEGLLLLTTDGDLANALQHPSREVEREYRVDVAGAVTPAVARQLRSGVVLEDGPARARKVGVLEVGPVTSTLSIVLTEGRKREVRRMLSAVGHPVLRLRRTRFGPVELGGLERAAWRDLTPGEVEALRRVVG
jgi:23S rRNA pseudouridine2605 synthase